MVAVNYLWNPINDNIVREFDDAGSVVAEYTTEPDLYGNVVSQHRNGQTNYLHSDALGSTTELTNDAGNVTDTIRYSAFGEVTERTGATEIPFQFVGQKGYFNDSGGATYTVRRRRLISQLGTWLSKDPRYQNSAYHCYRYADNSPLLRRDPSGEIAVFTVTDNFSSAKCGTRPIVQFAFQLDKPAPCDGYFVQMIWVWCDVTRCMPCPDIPKPLPKKPNDHFWEAFEVKENERFDEFYKKDGHTDEAGINLPDLTCGWWISVAAVKFYCKDSNHPSSGGVGTGDLDKLWGKGGPWGTCGTQSGVLPATDVEPGFWKGKAVETTQARAASLAWYCCHDPKCDNWVAPYFVPSKVTQP